jgi:alcohol dehydrogenase class IV
MIKKYEGEGCITKLADIFNDLRIKKPLIIAGKRSFENSGAKSSLQHILSKYSTVRFSEFTENPKLEDVIKGLEIVKENAVDAIVAIGGGTAMDLAKLVSIYSRNDQEPEPSIVNGKTFSKPGIPLIAIPTTSGSGSEVTHFAVVYVSNKKYSIASPLIKPSFVIIDPTLTYSLPANQTACSGLDALCQGIESFWSINSTKESQQFAGRAIEYAWNNLEKAVNTPDAHSRKMMMTASNFAGRAIDITKTTAPHAFSYTLTSNWGICHGHAVALFMILFLEYNSNGNSNNISDARGIDYFHENQLKLLQILCCKDIPEVIVKFKILLKNINLENSFSEFSWINKTAIDTIINNVNTERLSNNPVKVLSNEIKELVTKDSEISNS